MNSLGIGKYSHIEKHSNKPLWAHGLEWDVKQMNRKGNNSLRYPIFFALRVLKRSTNTLNWDKLGRQWNWKLWAYLLNLSQRLKLTQSLHMGSSFLLGRHSQMMGMGREARLSLPHAQLTESPICSKIFLSVVLSELLNFLKMIFFTSDKLQVPNHHWCLWTLDWTQQDRCSN